MSFSFLRRTPSWHGAACLCLDAITSQSFRTKLGRLIALSASVALNSTVAASANLSWSDNSDNETGFSIERAIGDNDFVEIATVGTDSETFQDKEVQPGKQYSYRVRAFNNFGYSGYTNISTFVADAEDDTDLPIVPTDPGIVSDPEIPSSLIGSHSKKGEHSYVEDLGLHVLSGSGKGLRGTWDSLRLAYSSAEQDSSVTLHVPAISSAGSQSEASLIFRQNLSPNSRYVAVSLDQDFNASASWRTSDGDRVGRTRAAESVEASYLRISKDDTKHTLEASPDGFNWQTLSVKHCYLKSPYLVGFGISSLDNQALSYGAFEILESNVPLLNPSYSKYGPRPEPVLASDQNIASSYNFDPDILLHTLSAEGRGFEQFHDQLSFPSWLNKGPVRIAAKIHAFKPDGDWSRYGLMIRSGTGSDDAFAAIAINGKGQFEALWRNEKGKRISTNRLGNASIPTYLAIEYNGTSATLQYSRDGASWITLSELTISLKETYRIGPVLGSQNGHSFGAIEIIGLY